MTDSRSYDPFGEPITTGSTAVHLGFQGSWMDPPPSASTNVMGDPNFWQKLVQRRQTLLNAIGK
ncbi:hypothetical protein [Frankia sp. AgW1.1]|uniref:hypothetical protein n=1 Tax=Frankia sp. AgW1.1 TaxID=1836971 RepID=UPI00193458C5|nr:hypothetical protein [Frankia sp. AgW1.1]